MRTVAGPDLSGALGETMGMMLDQESSHALAVRDSDDQALACPGLNDVECAAWVCDWLRPQRRLAQGRSRSLLCLGSRIIPAQSPGKAEV